MKKRDKGGQSASESWSEVDQSGSCASEGPFFFFVI